jgi:hypothetical protein
MEASHLHPQGAGEGCLLEQGEPFHLTQPLSEALIRTFLAGVTLYSLPSRAILGPYLFFFSFSGWDETESTWYVGHCGPIVPALDDRWWLWSSWWNEDWQGKPKYSEKKYVELCTNPHYTIRHILKVKVKLETANNVRIFAFHSL